MKLLIKFPTRSRPQKFLMILTKYIRLLDDKDTKIIVTCDNDDTTMTEDYIAEVLSQHKNVTLCYGDNKNKVEAINANLVDVDFDVLLLASDDMVPLIKGYDTIIKNKMLELYPDTDGVLWFNDGYQGVKLNTLCILGKKYYDRFGYIYHPDYLSTWCDNEFMDVANILGKQTYLPEVIIQHQHPDWGHGNHDIIHHVNSVNVIYDNKVYLRRKAINFGL